MPQSNINGDVLGDVSVTVHHREKYEVLPAHEIVVHRMPVDEKEPSLAWLIKLRIDDINEDLKELLINANHLTCECATPVGDCIYSFADLRFLGAEQNIIKFGASIISQAVSFR